MNSISTILEQSFLLLPLLLGAYLTVSVMRIPFLALESAFIFGAAVGGQCTHFFAQATLLSLCLSVGMALLAGAAVGVCAALIQQWVPRVSAVLASIVTVGIFQAFTMLVLRGSHVTLSANVSPLRIVPLFERYPDLPVVVAIGIFLTLVCALFLQTQFGLLCALYGSNHNFLKIHGLNNTTVVAGGMALGAGLAGVSGYCIAQTNGFVDIYAGHGIVLLSITALMLGSGVRSALNIYYLGSLNGAVLLPVIGITLYVILQYVLVAAGFAHQYFNAVQALLIIGYCLVVSWYDAGDTEHNELGV